ncbi:MAG: hypothetical protein ABWX73_10670 [Marmoricola sp.]
MLAIVRTPQREAVVWLEAQRGEGRTGVGPTSAAGWTAIWWWDDGYVDPVALRSLAPAFLAIIARREDQDELVVSHPMTGVPSRFAIGSADANARESATRLCSLFDDCGDPESIVSLLESADSWIDLLVGLHAELDLPETGDAEPDTVVVAHRGDPEHTRMAVRMVGPAYLLRTGRWSLVVPVPDDEDAHDADVLAAVVSAGAGRKDMVLSCWRRGAESGFECFRKGESEQAWTWNSRWVVVSRHEVETEEAIAAFIRAQAPDPPDGLTVRTMLRRQGSDPDPLDQFMTMMGLPSEALALLGPRDDSWRDRLELVERRSAWRATVEALTKPFRAEASSRNRGAIAAYAAAATMAAVLCVVLTVASIVDPASWTDGPSRYVFWGLSVVLVPMAVVRWRRVRSFSG